MRELGGAGRPGRGAEERADVVIVGAGCAGLSLAARLADPAHARALAGRRVVVVDARTGYARDRTWCYWDAGAAAAGPFAGAVTRRWARWRVVGPDAAVERGSARHPYLHVPADAFYAEALARVRRAGHVELRLGTAVHALTDEGDRVRVDTARGPITAACVFDARPPGVGCPAHRSPRGDARLVQAFAGAVVRTAPPPTAPAFDPGTATLMDFTVPWAGPGLAFGYVLPYTRCEALVEVAVVAPEPPPREALQVALARYAARLTGGRGLEVVLREAGAIPMDGAAVDRRPSPRVVRIGVGGGLARPSTGYAYLAIQRDAERAAAALVPALAGGAAGGAPDAAALDRALAACARSPRGRAAAWLDRVFLRRLAADPRGAPAVFARLFARAEPDALVRFLSDAATPGDVARVVAALPPLPYAAEAVRAALEAGRAVARGAARDGRTRPPARGDVRPPVARPPRVAAGPRPRGP